VIGKKQFLGNALSGLGFLRLFELLQRLYRNQRQLTVLTYHRVLDIEPEHYPFDGEVVSATVLDFESQVAFLKQHFNPITFETLRRHFQGETRLPPAPVILTFDDGYRDNYTAAFPILKRYEIPATIFVVTELIGTNQPFWFEKVVYLLKQTRKPRIALPAAGLDPLAIPSGDRRQLCRAVLARLKEIPDAARLESISQLENQIEVGVREEDVHLVRPLSWDEIREMHRWGIEIGSHTATHPILSQVQPDKLIKEIVTSRARIEEELGTKVHVLSYPVGGKSAYSGDVKAALAQAGYAFGVTYARLPNYLNHLDPYAIGRIGVDLSLDLTLFRCNLVAPKFFGYQRKGHDAQG
jgi:peptidoglycan/xylan/chitin deacetylase (PgdA/CDA1 family)